MNRPFKFRAWDNGNKTYLRRIANISFDMARQLHHVDGEQPNRSDITVFYDKLVLEQYTGLKDKNGKEIYEGDILKIGGQLAEVIFDDDKGCYMGEFKINYEGVTIRDRDFFHDFKESREIVGNIHENLELLWGKDGRDK